MNSVDEFQIYLLSKMSASGLVDRALRSLGSSPDSMPDIANDLVKRCGLQDGLPHSEYHALLGSVWMLERSTADVEASAFRGSVSFYYRLPLWPKTPFQVNKHSRGYAWGLTFVQDPRLLQKPSTADSVRAWEYALDGVRALYHWYERDLWSDYHRDLYQLPGGSELTMREGTYDFGLLQLWATATRSPSSPEWRLPRRMVLDP